LTTFKIVIVDYDPNWSYLFEMEKDRLNQSIGPWVLDIQHIGSTSVPGLGAKPIIDIMIGVKTLQDADTYCLAPISGLGYDYVKKYEDQMPFRRYFHKNQAENTLEYHIHLVESGSEFWERHIAFRDYLRMNKETARQYEELKRFLAPQFSDGNEYASAKTKFIKGVEEKALKQRNTQTI
jgi:GrpB-like predicted nucleotidyltransferase (UPF0157 family)